MSSFTKWQSSLRIWLSRRRHTKDVLESETSSLHLDSPSSVILTPPLQRPLDAHKPGTPPSLKLQSLRQKESANESRVEPSTFVSHAPSPPDTLQSRSEPESSLARQTVVEVLPSVNSPSINRWRVTAAGLGFFIQGMNDSAPGALLPYIEPFYGINYTLVSLVFIANALGYLIVAPFVQKLNSKLGRGKTLSGCAALNALAYTIIVCGPPFALVVIAFFLQGLAFAIILSLDNVFICNLRGGTILLGYMHGLYGVGGVVAPFVATAMVSGGIKWSRFYCLPLMLSIINSFWFFFSFSGYESEMRSLPLTRVRTSSSASTVARNTPLRKALTHRVPLLGSLFIFAYQGAEVAISGWVISFLIDFRNGDPAHVGYVTSGFWGGITLGRFLLVRFAHKMGDKVSTAIAIVLALAFQFLIWFVPNIIGNAVAVAIIGFILGPIAPLSTALFSKLVPQDIQITSLGLISSMGSSGGAVAPFITGLMAQRLGTVVLNPICIVLYVIMEGAWLSLPRLTKRSE